MYKRVINELQKQITNDILIKEGLNERKSHEYDSFYDNRIEEFKNAIHELEMAETRKEYRKGE